jgi:hypothetical protein
MKALNSALAPFHPPLAYIKTRMTQQTNICLGIHRLTCVGTFNPTCLSRLIATQGRLFLGVLITGDVRVG